MIYRYFSIKELGEHLRRVEGEYDQKIIMKLKILKELTKYKKKEEESIPSAHGNLLVKRGNAKTCR